MAHLPALFGMTATTSSPGRARMTMPVEER
jgi:hypothetical protein